MPFADAADVLEMPPDYLSPITYAFLDSQHDDIIRVTTYNRMDHTVTAIWSPRAEHDNIRLSIATDFQQGPHARSALGALGLLPAELWHEIFLYMDLRALFEFRQVNVLARTTMNTFWLYRSLATHGLQLFRALLGTGVARTVYPLDFERVLCTQRCCWCPRIGRFIFIPTWERCCYRCLNTAPEAAVQSRVSAAKDFGLLKVDFDQLRVLTTLPGTYLAPEATFVRRIRVISARLAWQMAREIPPRPSRLWRKLSFMASCALPYLDRLQGKTYFGLSCAGCDIAYDKGIINPWGYTEWHRRAWS